LALPLLLLAGEGRAEWPDGVPITFSQAVKVAERIVAGKITARRDVKIDGAIFQAVEVEIESVLKGLPAARGTRVSVFDHRAWYHHIHAEALRRGLVTYRGSYATPIPDADIKPGAAVLVFLRNDRAPAGFPAGAAFLLCSGAFERGQRVKDIGKLKTARFGETVRMAMGEIVTFPSGFEIEAVAHTHKRPMVGGPRKEMAELGVASPGGRGVLTLGHVIDPDGKETWEKKVTESYEIELLGMKYDAETTLRVRRVEAATPRSP
jgi:hypothetical protein